MRHILLATTALVFTGLSLPAFAQQAAEEVASDDTIIVTSRLREEKLIDVPLPVTVATAEQIARDKVYTISDLQRITPALEISQTSGGEVTGGARLRGLGTGVFNNSVSPSVAFVVDQVPQGNLTFPILFDLGQVEVLRGPQGTLFGQGASAGVINISTVTPTTDRIKVSAALDWADKGTLGSEVGEIIARAGLNVPLSDTAALRFATYYKRETGVQRNTFLGKDNKISDLGLRLKGLFKPTEQLTINLSGEYTQTISHGWNFFAIATTPNSTTPLFPNGPPRGAVSTGNFLDPTGCNIPKITARAEFYCEDTQAQFRNKASAFSSVIDYELSDTLKLTSVTAYRTLTRKTETVNFSRRLGIAARSENVQGKSNQFSQELRLSYAGENLNLLVGALYSRFKTEALPIRNIPFGNLNLGARTGFSVCTNTQPGFCPVPLAFGYELTKDNTKALFADATYSFTDQLDLFGGVRYSNYHNTTGVNTNAVVVQAATPATTTSPFIPSPVPLKDNNVSGRIGLSYKPDTNSTLYASFSKGYKPPAIVVATIAGVAPTPLKPEQATAFELGGKIALGRLQLSANIFSTKIKNFQTQSSGFNTAGALISLTSNIPSVKSKGFELGVFGKLSDNFSINAGYQYNDVKFPTGFVGDDGISLSRQQFLNAPKHKFTVSGDFSVPVSDSIEAFLNANLVYKSKVLLAQRGNPIFRYKGHELINGSLGLRSPDDKWSASLFVRNLTKQREPAAYLASDFAGAPDGGVRAWALAGLTARVLGGSLSFNF
jgi:iron complex outermembrane recepter protein